jgi:hypothetical protein
MLAVASELEPTESSAAEETSREVPPPVETPPAMESSSAADAPPVPETPPPAAAAEGEEAPTSEVDQWTPFTATDGRRMRVSCTLEPVIQLASSAPIGYRLARRALELPSERALSPLEQNNLSRADIGKIDFATIARGLDRLSAESGESALPCLVLPISCVTLSNYGARNVLSDLLKKAKDVVRHGLICEMCDVEGVPHGALQAAIQTIRPFSLRVVGRLREPPGFAVRQLKGSGFDGLSIECPEFSSDQEFVGWTRNVVQVCRPVTKTLFVFQVGGIRHAAIASHLGVTHVTVAAGRPMLRQAPSVEAEEDCA